MKQFLRNSALVLFCFLAISVIYHSALPYHAGSNQYSNQLNELKKYKANIVLFGSSRTYRHINPLLLDSLMAPLSTKSFNMAPSGCFGPESYYLLENFLKNSDVPSIEFVLLELQGLEKHDNINKASSRANYWIHPSSLPWLFAYIKQANYKQIDKKNHWRWHYLELLLYGYLSSWKIGYFLPSGNENYTGKAGHKSFKDEMTSENAPEYAKRKLQFSRDTIRLRNRIQAAKFADQFEPSSAAQIPALHKKLCQLDSLAKLRGIKLYYHIPLRLEENEYRQLLPVAEMLPADRLISLYSYSENKELYTRDISFDAGHLNEKGTRLYTVKLAEKWKALLQNKKVDVISPAK